MSYERISKLHERPMELIKHKNLKTKIEGTRFWHFKNPMDTVDYKVRGWLAGHRMQRSSVLLMAVGVSCDRYVIHVDIF